MCVVEVEVVGSVDESISTRIDVVNLLLPPPNCGHVHG